MAEDPQQILEVGAVIDLSQILPGFDRLANAATQATERMGDVFATAGLASDAFVEKLELAAAKQLDLENQVAAAKLAVRQSRENIGTDEPSPSMLRQYNEERLRGAVLQKQLNEAVAEYRALLDQVAAAPQIVKPVIPSIPPIPPGGGGGGDPFSAGPRAVFAGGGPGVAEDIDAQAFAESSLVTTETAETATLVNLETLTNNVTVARERLVEMNARLAEAEQLAAAESANRPAWMTGEAAKEDWEATNFAKIFPQNQPPSQESPSTGATATPAAEALAVARANQANADANLQTAEQALADAQNTSAQSAVAATTASATLQQSTNEATTVKQRLVAANEEVTASEVAVRQANTALMDATVSGSIQEQAVASNAVTAATERWATAKKQVLTLETESKIASLESASATASQTGATVEQAAASTEASVAIATNVQSLVDYNVAQRAGLAATEQGMTAIQNYAQAQAAVAALTSTLPGLAARTTEQESLLAEARQKATTTFREMIQLEQELGIVRKEGAAITDASTKATALAATETGALTAWSVKMALQFKAQGLSTAEAASALQNLGLAAEETAATLEFAGFAVEELGLQEDATAAKTRNMVSSMGAARVEMGAITGSSGMIAMGLARVAAASATLGPIMQAAFPAFLGLALIDMLAMGIDKFEKWNDLGNQAIKNADQLTLSTAKEADALEVANLKLDNTIAKFHGLPENLIAVAMAEAKGEADKLAGSLETVFQKMQKDIDAAPGFFSAFAKGAVGIPTSNVASFAGELKPLQENIEKAQLALQTATTEEARATAQAQLHNTLIEAREKLEQRLASEKATVVEGPEGTPTLQVPDEKAIATFQSYINTVNYLLQEQHTSRILAMNQEDFASDQQFKENLDRTSKETEAQLAADKEVSVAKIKSAEQVREIRVQDNVLYTPKGEYALPPPSNKAIQEENAERQITATTRVELEGRLAIEQEYVARGIGDHLAQVTKLNGELEALEINSHTKIQAIRTKGYEEIRKAGEEETAFFTGQKLKQLDEQIKLTAQTLDLKNKQKIESIKYEEQETARVIDLEQAQLTALEKIEEGKLNFLNISATSRTLRIAQMQAVELEQVKKLEEEKAQAAIAAKQKELGAIVAGPSGNRTPFDFAVTSPVAGGNASTEQEREQYAKVFAEIVALKQAQQKKMLDIDTQIALGAQKAALDYQKFWDGAFAPIHTALNGMVQGILQGTLTVSQAFRRMGQNIVVAVAQSLAQSLLLHLQHSAFVVALEHTTVAKKILALITGEGTKKGVQKLGNTEEISGSTATTGAVVSNEGIKTGAVTSGQAQQTGAVAGAQTTQESSIAIGNSVKHGLEVAAGIASATVAAGEGAAWAFASVLEALPFPANVAAAPGVAATQFAAIEAFGIPKAMKGALLSQDMLVQAHAGELILPPALSSGVQSIVKNQSEPGRGGGDGSPNTSADDHSINFGDLNYAPTFHSPTSPAQDPRKIAKMIKRQLSKQTGGVIRQ
jgi:hypothetical protein